jgi:hypothetical protein
MSSPAWPKRLTDWIEKTMIEVEETSGLPTDDPALVALKQLLSRRLEEVLSGIIEIPRDWTPGRGIGQDTESYKRL